MDGTPARTGELLAQVNAAIAAVLAGGQSYQLGDRSLTRANLSQLRALRDDLEAQAEQAADSGLLARTYVAFFDSR